MNLFEMLFQFRVAGVDSFFPLYGVYAKSGKEGKHVILKWKIAISFFLLLLVCLFPKISFMLDC